MADVFAHEYDVRLGAMRRNAAAAQPRLTQNLRALGAVGPVIRPPAAGSRSVIIEGNVTRKVHTTSGQVHYLKHQAGHDGQDAHLFTLEGQPLDVKAFVASAQQDPHQFRFSVNPESPPQYLPLQPLIESLMARMEADLGRPLEWVAAVHHNTGRPHAHVIVRGKDRDGQDLYIRTDYLQHGLRYRASQLATQLLGPVQTTRPTPSPKVAQSTTAASPSTEMPRVTALHEQIHAIEGLQPPAARPTVESQRRSPTPTPGPRMAR